MVKPDDKEPPNDALSECKETVEQLRQENVELRNSALTFGDLAERLNKKQGDSFPAKHKKSPAPRRPGKS